MNGFEEYYVFITHRNLDNTIISDCVKVDDPIMDKFIHDYNIALSPKFKSEIEKDEWLIPSNIKSINDKLLAYIDVINNSNPQELIGTTIKLLHVPDEDGKGFSMGEITMNIFNPYDKDLTHNNQKEKTLAKIINLDDYRR